VRVLEGLALADLVVAPSKTMLNALEQHYGPFAASAVIPNGRSNPQHHPTAKENIILGAGRLWDEAKNIGALVQAARNLPCTVYLAGERRESNDRGTPDSNVCHLGQLSSNEMQTWFERAAIFVAPAKYEPFGLSILEAALMSCAMVLGDIPSLRENWDGAALFIPPGDVTALEAALRELIASPSMRWVLGAKALEIASRFTPERMSEEYLDAYRDLLGKRNGEIAPGERLPSLKREKEFFGLWKGTACI